MIKNHKIIALTIVIIGLCITLMTAFADTDDYNRGILCGMGTSLTAVGLLRLVRLYGISRNPEKAANYEAANKDERILYIVNKARALVFLISIYTQLAISLIAQFVFAQRLLSTVLCYFTCFQCLLFVGVYYYYSKKY